jgi:hypothetical protein
LSYEIKKVVEESEFYTLAVVKLPDVPVDVYGIINKEHGVCEMSVSVLPQAKESLAQFTKWMQDAALPDLHEGIGTLSS